MRDVMRLTLIGCGAIARWHLQGIRDSRAPIDVVAVVDPDSDRARALADETGATPFASLGDALAGVEFDAVDIMVPHDLHEELAVEALAAGKHVLLEKPMATDLAACERILTAAERAAQASSVVFMVGENAQYWPEILTAQELVESGAIGDLVTVRATAFFPPLPDFYEAQGAARAWRLDDRVAGGGIAIDTGSHWIRPLRVWLGEIEETVAAIGRPFDEMQGESLVRALVRGRHGVVASCDLLLTPAPMAFGPLFSLTGTDGEISIEPAGEVRLFDGESPAGRVVGERGGYFASFAGEFADFTSAVLEGKPLAAGPRASVGELRVAHAMYRSAETRTWEPVW